MSIILCFE